MQGPNHYGVSRQHSTQSGISFVSSLSVRSDSVDNCPESSEVGDEDDDYNDTDRNLNPLYQEFTDDVAQPDHRFWSSEQHYKMGFELFGETPDALLPISHSGHNYSLIGTHRQSIQIFNASGIF